ncbi:uncharacterized protein LOC121733021 [Aricia agestis]|uniref:uncharacterized protein LOC121733021 n=1 Tax=Aricia agestis TaxID=91739 RepID=UPI001C204389|nr:uncharacterized protein LOC121733021 [Aricia agestis]
MFRTCTSSRYLMSSNRASLSRRKVPYKTTRYNHTATVQFDSSVPAHCKAMDSPILILAVFSLSICLGLTEHGSYTIPVEGYDSELQDLGEHVDVPETPVRVIKITKTIAVKVPVPYPVKVIEKVPYPVHVNRPYPVPVPQIVRVPQQAPNPHHEQQIQQHQALDVAHAPFQNIHAGGNSYRVQEGSPHDSPQTDDHYEVNTGDGEGYSGALHADYSADGSPGSYYGGSDDYSGDQDGHNSNVAFKQLFNSKK